ncbi:MAG: MBL fold metallo-hydrolase RNA specificity domain-containing protein [Thermosulfidibacteraceae bacterium]
MANFRISFHGASGGVTGSCFLIEYKNTRVLVDCGLFQGLKEDEIKNYEPFRFDSSTINYLILTHGHLDHCGRIPVLVKKGFRGRIICTDATYDIARVVLLDAGKLKCEDYKRQKKEAYRKGSPLPLPPPYCTIEVLDSFDYFSPTHGYGRIIKIGDFDLVLHNAGHIIGSAFVELKTNDFNIVFSGDLGNKNKPLTPDPQPPPKSDFLVVESTYGDRDHKSFEETVSEFRKVIVETIKRKGNVVIPAFAVERAQEIIYILKNLMEKKEIPYTKVFLDSPMASEVINIMKRHSVYLREEIKNEIKTGKDPFDFSALEIIEDVEESKSINNMSGVIIIAGSGMCNGGRILHHLKHNIWKEESSIVFVGFQAVGTLGREIVDGKEEVDIMGNTYKVRASICTINGFSSHMSRSELVEWIERTRASKVFIVHGEEDARNKLMELVKKEGREIILPQLFEEYTF